jgi:hypothetical protein
MMHGMAQARWDGEGEVGDGARRRFGMHALVVASHACGWTVRPAGVAGCGGTATLFRVVKIVRYAPRAVQIRKNAAAHSIL